jgi:hypothetical protein
MPPAEFEPAIPASDRLQIIALDLSVTGIGSVISAPHRMLIRLVKSRRTGWAGHTGFWWEEAMLRERWKTQA